MLLFFLEEIMPSLDAIVQDVEMNVNAGIRRAAVKIGTMIQEGYEIAITAFYSDFSPIMYDRTYSLYEGAIGVGGYGVYYKQLEKCSYECGIRVGGEYYSYDPYVKEPPHGLALGPGDIFPNAWQGDHGGVKKTAAPAGKMDYRFRVARSKVPGIVQAELGI